MKHTSTKLIIMWTLSRIIAISFSLYLKENLTYRYTTRTILTPLSLSKGLDIQARPLWNKLDLALSYITSTATLFPFNRL